MFPTKQLYDLQELDWDIAAHEESLEDVKSRLADDSALVSTRERLQGLEAQLEERAPPRRQLESAVQQLGERLQATEARQYDGSVTNPRELSALQEELNSILVQRGVEEEKLLELMVEVDELQSARDSARDELGRLEAERTVGVPDLVKQEELLTGEMEALRRARGEMTPQIPPAGLSVYESLRKTRKGYAVAKVERAMCQGCRLALPTMELQRARISQGLVQCSSCARILYVV